MYCKYIYVAGATTANILSDIVALLTDSATTVDQLSASCDKAGTELIRTRPGGWTMYDSWTSTRNILSQAPWDSAQGYTTPALLDLEVTTTYLNIRLHETWNNTSRVGTNTVGQISGNATQRINVTSGGSLYISSSSSHFACFSLQNNVWGSVNSGATIVVQRTRTSGETPERLLSPAVYSHSVDPSNNNNYIPKLFNSTTQSFANSVGVYLVNSFSSFGSAPNQTLMPAAPICMDGVKRLFVSRMRACSTAVPSTDFGTLLEIYMSPSGGLANLDTAIIEGVTYEYWNANTSNTAIIPVWIPRS